VDEFLERRRVPIIVALLIIIAGGVFVLVTRWPRLSSSTGQSGFSSSKLSQPTLPAIRTVEKQLKVYVTGGVLHPGVYSFKDGDRVEDAIEAAGGLAEGADATRLNMAQRLRDEGQIVVPLKSDTPIPGSASPAQAGKVNINAASAAQLEALPGIGDTYAQRIVEHRTKNGPFQKTTDLVDKKLIPQSTFEKIRDLIDVQ
jgi:competence protein ComEA